MESYWGASGELVGSYGKICQQCCSFQDKLLTHEDVSWIFLNILMLKFIKFG